MEVSEEANRIKRRKYESGIYFTGWQPHEHTSRQFVKCKCVPVSTEFSSGIYPKEQTDKSCKRVIFGFSKILFSINNKLHIAGLFNGTFHDTLTEIFRNYSLTSFALHKNGAVYGIDGAGNCIFWDTESFSEVNYRNIPHSCDMKTPLFISLGYFHIAIWSKANLQVSCGKLISEGLVPVKECLPVTYQPEVNDVRVMKPSQSHLPSQLAVREVSCGGEHCLILINNGLLYSMGCGSRGQLGHGDISSTKSNTCDVIEALYGVCVTGIAAGGWHSLAVSDIGDVYSWGWNESGQLAVPCTASVVDATSSNPIEAINVATLPNLISFEYSDIDVVKVAAGTRHSLALTRNGAGYSWGWNKYGQLGVGDEILRDKPTLVTVRGEGRISDIQAGLWTSVFYA